jgi:glutamate racemase
MGSCAGPIGVFDSGLGGLSVLKTLQQILPYEDFIYYGDSSRAPYGPLPKDKVIQYSDEIVRYFISREAKAVVIACNTATSAAADYLRECYDFPIIGMEPALKPAALAHAGDTIAVLATEMTLREAKFERLMSHYETTSRILKLAVPEFVTLVEQGIVEGAPIKHALDELFSKEQTENIAAIVLGCTHYVFLKDSIVEFFKGKVTVYDGNMGTARQLKNVLSRLSLLNTSKKTNHIFGSLEIINSAGEAMVEQSFALLNKT